MAVVGESVSVHEDCHAHLAEAFGMLAAIESESWQFTHPQEFAALQSKFKCMLVADREGRLVACATSRPTLGWARGD